MLIEHPVEPRDLRRKVFRPEPEQNDAGVLHTLPEDEFAEVSIVCDQDSPFSAGDVEHFIVIQGSWMVADD